MLGSLGGGGQNVKAIQSGQKLNPYKSAKATSAGGKRGRRRKKAKRGEYNVEGQKVK